MLDLQHSLITIVNYYMAPLVSYILFQVHRSLLVWEILIRKKPVLTMERTLLLLAICPQPLKAQDMFLALLQTVLQVHQLLRHQDYHHHLLLGPHHQELLNLRLSLQN